MEKGDGDTIMGICRARWFYADYFSLSPEVGGLAIVQEWQGCGDGEVKNLAGLETGGVSHVKKAPRQADISNYSPALG